MPYYSFWSNNIPWNYPSITYRVLGAFLRGGVLIGGPPDDYVFIFYFFFRFGEIFKYVWLIRGPPGPF